MARGLHAGTVPSLLNIMRTKRFRVEGGSAVATTDAADYAISIQAGTATDVEGVIIGGLSIGSAPGERLASMQGTDCQLVDLDANVNTATTSSSLGHIHVTGERNQVIRPRLREIGAGSRNGVQFQSGTGHRLEHPDMSGVQHIARVISTATIVYDPSRNTAIQTDMVRAVADTRLIVEPTRVASTVGTGAGLAPNPSRQTTTAINATGTSYTVNNPPVWSTTTGGQHTIEITNASAGAQTATWGALYQFGPAWVNPATGKTTFITFQYNGTNWVEVSRTA